MVRGLVQWNNSNELLKEPGLNVKIVSLDPKLYHYLYLDQEVDDTQLPGFWDFDKDGFDLNELEAYLYHENGLPTYRGSNRTAMQFRWFEGYERKKSGVLIDHSYVMARYAYTGELRKQISCWASQNPQFNKLLQLRPKWGFDVNIEHINGNGFVTDVFHIEEDFFDFREYNARKTKLERLVIETNWEIIAQELQQRADEWCTLTGDDENDYKAKFVGWERAYKTKKVI